MRRLWGYMLRRRGAVTLSLAGAALGGLAQATVPLAERQIVNGVIITHRSPLWPWLALMVGLAAATFGFAYLRRYYGGRVALGVQYDLRNAMHDHLQRMDAATLQRMPTGQLVGRANSDATLVQGLLNFFPIMSSNVLLVILSIGVMVWLSPLLSVVSLVLLPALAILSYRMRSRVFPASWDAQQREGEVVQIVDEGLSGVRVVKAFGQERRELERVTRAAEGLYGSQMRAVRLQARFQPVLQAIPGLGQAAILALGGWMVLHHRISLGTFLAFSTYVAQLVAPAQRLASLMTIAQQARAGVERIFQLLDLEPRIADAPAAVALPGLRGDVEFRDVTFGYGGGGEAALDGFSLEVRAGQRVALVGPSGSGKSSAVFLLERFDDPQTGAVLVDGHDLRDVTLASLRRQIGVAFEDSFLFSESVRDNISYSRPDAPFEEIVAAARAAGAHDFIRALPDGYDTTVGERGLSLSGGQRQRVALARALLGKPRILVLDDATSAVDATTEEAVHAALREVMAGRTTILVAHRRSTLRLAERIVVVDHGRVVEDGEHDELMARSELYRALLSGLEDVDPPAVGDPNEAPAEATMTPAAWRRSPPAADATALAPASVAGAPSLGMGLGGGSGGSAWRSSLAPTPELLARVAALPPVRDAVQVDVDAETRPDPAFGLRRLLLEFRRPLALGLVLVVIDAVAVLAGPLLVEKGVNRGVEAGSAAAVFTASAVYALVILANLVDQVAQTFVTGRTAQRIMLCLRVRIWGQLQRLSLDFYEREMAGRIMTRMTTDVDQFEALIENGVLAALVSLVTFAGVGVALLAINPVLGLATMSVVVPLALATVAFRRRLPAIPRRRSAAGGDLLPLRAVPGWDRSGDRARCRCRPDP